MKKTLLIAVVLLCATGARGSVYVYDNTLVPGAFDVAAFSANTGDLITGSTWSLDYFDLDTVFGLFRPDASAAAGDDDSNLGFLSALRFAADATGTWEMKASGYPDFGFTGAHSESGSYRLVVSTADTGTESGGNNSIATAQALAVLPNGGARMGGTIESGLADYYSFEAVAGSMITIETHSGVDTMVGLFDASGGLLAGDDDGGIGLNSALIFIASYTGTYYISVTAFPDFDFTGAHGSFGDYKLVVSGARFGRTVVPEPSSVILAITGFGGLGIVAMRRRRNAEC